MNNLYVACDFDVDRGRVMLGTLHQNKLAMSEVRRFQNLPVRDKHSLHWNIPQLFQETLAGLHEIGGYLEHVHGISCDSWPVDYLLFGPDGSLIAPTYHHLDPRTDAGMKEVFAKVPRETIYDETGVQSLPASTLFQLAAEKPRRLKRAQLLPVADGFNYLLAGVPRVEMSLASATQLFNPVTQSWSDRLLNAMELPAKLFPPVVPAGTQLGALRPELAAQTGLEDARVVASCSDEIAAALAGLPVGPGERWAFLRVGASAVMGAEVAEPVINDVSREMNFTNKLGYEGAVCFSKRTAGLWILDECRHAWEEKDRELNMDLLTHLAISAPPFESLINPEEPRLLAPGDMPSKIQAFCRETDQPVPRKPGPIMRCVLESLALTYRKVLREIEYLTGRKITRLYVLDGSANDLLNHFTANALQVPVVVAPADAAAIGNVIVQALALGHVESLAAAREIVLNSFRTETIIPHAAAWDAAYDRLAKLVAG